jgi:hypothetical protein
VYLFLLLFFASSQQRYHSFTRKEKEGGWQSPRPDFLFFSFLVCRILFDSCFLCFGGLGPWRSVGFPRFFIFSSRGRDFMLKVFWGAWTLAVGFPRFFIFLSRGRDFMLKVSLLSSPADSNNNL